MAQAKSTRIDSANVVSTMFSTDAYFCVVFQVDWLIK